MSFDMDHYGVYNGILLQINTSNINDFFKKRDNFAAIKHVKPLIAVVYSRLTT